MRKTLLLAVATFALLGASGCDKQSGTSNGGGGGKQPVAKVAPPAGKDWTQVVSKTPDGGYVMGNPNAPIKLVEYASVTCPHCAEFETAAYDDLTTNFVKTGQLSFEQRNFLLNPFDIPITILTRCSGPETFFPLTKAVYDNQESLLAPLRETPPAGLQTAFQQQDFFAAAQQMKILDFFTSRGISESQARACLGDQSKLKELVQMRDHATNDLEVSGTPSFFINGEAYDFTGWPALKTRLQELGAR